MKDQAVPIMRGRSIRICSGIRDGWGIKGLRCKEGGHRLNRERRDLLTACRIHGLDSGRLHKRAKMMLGFRHKREAYKGMYDRKERMAGRGRMAQELRKALYCIHNLEVEDMEALTGAFAVLSGSGMLDDIIEEAIDTAVSRFVVGEKYYRPILDMRYDGHGGDLWMVIEKRINIEHSQTAERHKEAVLAVGLAFFTEVYEFCVRRLLMEEDKEERTALKKHRVKKIKGIKVVTKAQGRPDRASMPRPAVFNMKAKYDRGREKRQARKEIDEQY